MGIDIKSSLHEIADGIRSDLFKVSEALNLLQMVGINASSINESGFGIFFGSIQFILKEQIILLLAKMFEKPSEYPLKSIPSAIKLITENKSEFISIESNDETVLMLLEKLGYKSSIEKEISVTKIFCKYWSNTIGETKTTRQNIDTLRNKVSAHHENVDENLLSDVSISEIHNLIKYAELFLSILDSAYFDLCSVDYEGNYFVNSEAKTASLVLKNLLVEAKIIDVKTGREIARKFYE